MILTLGDHPITLTWEDYTAAWPNIFSNTPFCKVEIIGVDFDQKMAILGLKAWRKFDVSFDMEHDEIACKSHIFLIRNNVDNLTVIEP